MNLDAYEKKVKKLINIIDNDVEPEKLYELANKKKLTLLASDYLFACKSELLKHPKLTKMPKSKDAFAVALDFVTKDLKKHKRLYFWHYVIFSIITLFSYLDMRKKNLHKTVALWDNKIWEKPNLIAAVLYLNFAAGSLYENQLIKLIQSTEKQGQENVLTLLNFCIEKIKLMNAEY